MDDLEDALAAAPAAAPAPDAAPAAALAAAPAAAHPGAVAEPTAAELAAAAELADDVEGRELADDVCALLMAAFSKVGAWVKANLIFIVPTVLVPAIIILAVYLRGQCPQVSLHSTLTLT